MSKIMRTVEVDLTLLASHGINVNDAAVYKAICDLCSNAFAIKMPSGTYHQVSRAQIHEYIYYVSDKPDTTYRYVKKLQAKGLISCISMYGHEYICTDPQVSDLEVPDTNIYLMKDGATGLYKIGKAKNPKVRERTLQSERPSIAMVGHWPMHSSRENTLHRQYAKERVRGEWFRLTTVQVRHICNTLTNESKARQ